MADVFSSPQTILRITAGAMGSTTPTSRVSVNFGVDILENATTITQSYCITTGTGAFSAGPLKIADGVVVTVPNNSTWRIV